MNDKLTKYSERAKIEMAKWALDSLGWTFRYNNRKRALGVCKFNTKSIELSIEFVNLNSHAEIMDTIRHEIAHALAGPKAKHGRHWKQWAVKCGARPKSYAKDIKMTYNYIWVCEKCGDLDGGYHRLPKRRSARHKGCLAQMNLKDVKTGRLFNDKITTLESILDEVARTHKINGSGSLVPLNTSTKPENNMELNRVYQGIDYRIEEYKSKTIIVKVNGQKVQAFKKLRSIAEEKGLSFNFEKINTRSLGKKLLDHLLSN